MARVSRKTVSLCGFTPRDSNRDTATHDATHGHQNHDERVDIVTDEMSQAHGKVVGLVLNGAQPKRKAS